MSEQASAFFPAWGPMATGTVKAVHGARIEVTSASCGSVDARLAVLGAYSPRVGDQVLIAVADNAHYVIGVVRALREARSITADDGSSVSLEEEDGTPRWRLRDREGRLLFEHLGDKSIVYTEDDLEIRAGGDLSFAAAGAVRIESGEQIEASCRGPIELTSNGPTDQSSFVRLDGDRARFETPRLEMIAERADVKLTDANVVVHTLRTVAHRIRERAELVERNAGRIVEHAREVFREVEELSQTKAGRLKLIADTALTLLGRSTLVKAREDVKIKGEKIYLA